MPPHSVLADATIDGGSESSPRANDRRGEGASPADGAASGSGSDDEGRDGREAGSAPPDLRRDAGSASVGPAGGAVVAGAARVELGEGALASVTVVGVERASGTAWLARSPMPPGVLGAVRTSPVGVELRRSAVVTVPVEGVSAGEALELLLWQPSMRDFLVVARGVSNAEGTAGTFQTRLLGDMIVRRPPVLDADRTGCDAPSIRLRASHPPEGEDTVVGLTPMEERLSRRLAFNLLSDLRQSTHVGAVEFKNEEVVENRATRRSELAHVDEDWIADPNAAAATLVLGRLVLGTWTDPTTGQPAYRLRITEAFDALIEHSSRSTHYQGRAMDITLSPVPPSQPEERRSFYGLLSKLSVCSGFDWVLFENLYHVHASVLPTRYAFVVARPGGRFELWSQRLIDATRPPEALGSWDAPGATLDMLHDLGSGRWLVAGRAQGQPFALVVEGGVVRPAEVAEVVARPESPRMRTVDGLRRLAIVDGRLFLANLVGAPPIGSVMADGTPVAIEYPWSLGTNDDPIVAAAWADHAPTRQAWARWMDR